MKVRCFLWLLLLLFFGISTYSQDTSARKGLDRNVLSLEILGHSRALFSGSYERLFELNAARYLYSSLRLGVGYTPGVDVNGKKHKGAVSFPLVFSLIGGGQKHHIQLCVGYNALLGQDFVDSTTTVPTVYKKFESAYSVSLGYRYMWNETCLAAFPLLQWMNSPNRGFSFGIGILIGTTF